MVVDYPTSTPDAGAAAGNESKDSVRVEYLNLVIACAIVACVPTVWAIIEVARLSAVAGDRSEPVTFAQAINITRTLLACASCLVAWVGFAIIATLRRMSAIFAVTHGAKQAELTRTVRAELAKTTRATRAELAQGLAQTAELQSAHVNVLAARDRERDEAAHALVGAVDHLIRTMHELTQTILREGDERALAAVRQAEGQLSRIRLVDNTSVRHPPG